MLLSIFLASFVLTKCINGFNKSLKQIVKRVGLVKAVNLGNFWNEKWKNKMVILSFKMVIWGIHGYIKRKNTVVYGFERVLRSKLQKTCILIGKMGDFARKMRLKCRKMTFKQEKREVKVWKPSLFSRHFLFIRSKTWKKQYPRMVIRALRESHPSPQGVMAELFLAHMRSDTVGHTHFCRQNPTE